jgi:hypothetical protein
MQQKHTLVRALSALIFASGIATGAQAQTAGTFSGTSADGGTISMTVTETSGKFAITSLSQSFTADCKHTGDSVSNNFAGGTNFPITDGKASFTYEAFRSVYSVGSVKFSGSHAKGTITTDDVTFAPGTPPKSAEFCTVPKQAFSLTKTAPESPAMLAPVVAVTRAAVADKP